MSEARKAFVWTSRAWYAKSCLVDDTIDEISVGMYYPDGGCDYEFTLRWVTAGMEVCVFNDAFVAFKEDEALFKKLSCLGDNPQPKDAAFLLAGLGFVDDTLTKNPYGPRACETVCSRCKKNTCTSDAHPGICCACRSKELEGEKR